MVIYTAVKIGCAKNASCGVASCELQLRVASCELRVASCESRVASRELQVAVAVASCEFRVAKTRK